MRIVGLMIVVSLYACFAQANPRSNDTTRTLDTRYKWYGIFIGMDKTKLDTEITSFKVNSAPRFSTISNATDKAVYITHTGVSSLSYAGIKNIHFYWSENHKLLGYQVEFEPTQYQQWIQDLPMFFDGFDLTALTNDIGIEHRLSNTSIKVSTSKTYRRMLVTH